MAWQKWLRLAKLFFVSISYAMCFAVGDHYDVSRLVFDCKVAFRKFFHPSAEPRAVLGGVINACCQCLVGPVNLDGASQVVLEEMLALFERVEDGV